MKRFLFAIRDRRIKAVLTFISIKYFIFKLFSIRKMFNQAQQIARYRSLFNDFIFTPFRQYVSCVNSQSLTVAANDVILSFKYQIALVKNGQTFDLIVVNHNNVMSLSYSLNNVDFDFFNDFTKHLDGIGGLIPSLNEYYNLVLRENNKN